MIEKSKITEIIKKALNQKQAEQIMWDLLSNKYGRNNDSLLATFLTGIYLRGQKLDETVGLMKAIQRDRIALKVRKQNICGIVGGGRDDFKTINISTAAGLICASIGIPIAKNGCRAESSKTGTTDVLEALGANIKAQKKQLIKSLNKNSFALFDAEQYYPRMFKHYVGNVTWRNALSASLSIASAVKFDSMIFGTSDITNTNKDSITAGIIKEIGPQDSLIVCGKCVGFIDEISTAGESYLLEIRKRKIKQRFVVEAEDFGIKKTKPGRLAQKNTHQKNANALLSGISGKDKEISNCFCANAAAAIYISNKCKNLKDGFEQAEQAIAEGKPIETLKSFIIDCGGKPKWNLKTLLVY